MSDLKGKTPFTPYSGFTPGPPGFPTIPMPGGGIPPMIGECFEQEN